MGCMEPLDRVLILREVEGGDDKARPLEWLSSFNICNTKSKPLICLSLRFRSFLVHFFLTPTN